MAACTAHGDMGHMRRGIARLYPESTLRAMRATAAAACYLLTFLLASRRWVMALLPVFPGSYSSA